jgi:hypothetical protein
MSTPPDPSLSPGERRVGELLSPLGREAAPPAPDLVQRLLGRVRWQSGVRGAVRVVGTMAGGMAEAAAVLLGLGSRRRGGR